MRELNDHRAVARALHRERRGLQWGYVCMAGVTVLGLVSAVPPNLAVRVAGAALTIGAGWLFFVVRTRSRLAWVGQAVLDPLTGLFGRRYLWTRLREEADRALRYGACLSVAVVDLDDFKLVNDRYGHLRGDQVLRAFALAVRACLRRSDVAFRFGGEEFVLLLPDAAAADAAAMVRDLGRHLDEPLTWSAGIAECPVDSVDPERLLRLADDRLVEAKLAGKGRIGWRSGTLLLPPRAS